MNAFLTKSAGVLTLIAACAAGVAARQKPVLPPATVSPATGHRSGRALPIIPGLPPPQRTTRSRAVDVSMATLMGKNSLSPAGIQPGKAIYIQITNIPGEEGRLVSGLYPVSETGRISMPYIGVVKAAGLSGAELAGILKSHYRRGGIYSDPNIQVLTTIGCRSEEKTVMVGGQVRKPAAVPFAPGITLWGAVQAAGGSTEFGSLRRVKLIRDGQQKIFDLTKPEFKTEILQNHDVVEVPQKNVIGN